jgi:tRNA threonylcarbamoyladenosine biosynthesis protein TsaB
MGQPSALLTDLIRKGLTQAGWTLNDLDGFALSIGPGSFTGLRVGVATVKTMAWALKKPVLPVSSLEVLAQNLSSESGQIAPFVDARKAKVYTALFRSEGTGGVKRLTQDRLGLPEEVLRDLPKRTFLIGDGIRRYSELIRSVGDNRIMVGPDSACIPRAENLCRIAAARWPKAKVDDPHSLVPEYLYSKESDITGW